jgi:beta-mannosidase
MDNFAYISQIHQAIAVRTQSEHYRRYRSFLNDLGLGNTMCALYWQLNDVWAAPTWAAPTWAAPTWAAPTWAAPTWAAPTWAAPTWAAPTWASIDFDQRWKAAHYHAKQMFAPVLISMVIFSFNITT